MITPDSPLLAIPHDIDPKQSVFFDGIRLTAEMIEVAHIRLAASLTEIARPMLIVGGPDRERPGGLATSEVAKVLVDVWSLVNSIDRFRGLVRLFPGAEVHYPDGRDGDVLRQLQPIRDLRNAAQHVAERSDLIVSQQSQSLGEISWVTAFEDGRGEIQTFLTCHLAPGVVRSSTNHLPNPIGEEIDVPTGCITFNCAGRRADLSELTSVVRKTVKYLEDQVREWLKTTLVELREEGRDMVFAVQFEPTHPEAPR